MSAPLLKKELIFMFYDNDLVLKNQKKEEHSKNNFAIVIRHLVEEQQAVIWVNWNSCSCPPSYREFDSQYKRAQERIHTLLLNNNYICVRHTDNKESVYVRVEREQSLAGLGDFSLLSLPVRTYDDTYIAYAVKNDDMDVLYSLEWELDSYTHNVDYIDEEHLSELGKPDYVKRAS